MLERNYSLLDTRAVIAVRGPEAWPFLQALVSQDVSIVTPSQAAYGALLTPQGKYLHDFIMADLDGAVMLDCEAERADDLRTRLTRYRLRSQVSLESCAERLAVVGIWSDGVAATLELPNSAGACRPLADGCVFIDPRRASLGARAILARPTAAEVLAAHGFAEAAYEAFDAHRLALGVPEGARDMDVERTTLLEAGIDALNGVAWDKGCYIGQEITARMHHRGLLKKRLTAVTIDGPAPAPGTPITTDGRDVGTMRSASNGHGLALLRLDALDTGKPLTAGDAAVRPS